MFIQGFLDRVLKEDLSYGSIKDEMEARFYDGKQGYNCVFTGERARQFAKFIEDHAGEKLLLDGKFTSKQEPFDGGVVVRSIFMVKAMLKPDGTPIEETN